MSDDQAHPLYDGRHSNLIPEPINSERCREALLAPIVSDEELDQALASAFGSGRYTVSPAIEEP